MSSKSKTIAELLNENDQINTDDLGSGSATNGYVLTADGSGGTAWGTVPSSYGDSDVLSLFNASGSAPTYTCRAWACFVANPTGVNVTGTPTIQGSGNISSITSSNAGYYRANFTTPMPNTGYAIVGMTGTDGTNNGIMVINTRNTNYADFQTRLQSSQEVTFYENSIVVFA